MSLLLLIVCTVLKYSLSILYHCISGATATHLKQKRGNVLLGTFMTKHLTDSEVYVSVIEFEHNMV